jgi:hypothetical protein
MLALFVLVVVGVTFVTPGKAEADATAALAIAGVVIAGVILIAFLIIAATRDSRSAGPETRVVWIACRDGGCEPIASPFADFTPLGGVEGP